MALTIPFANALGPTNGPAGDGVIYGVAPQVAPVTALSQVHLVPFTKVYRGNADAAGAVTFSNVTTAANNDAVGDVSLFDAVNPTADRLCIELSAGDTINGISLLISTAAVLTGTPVADVYYRTASGWQSAAAIVTPLLTSTGLKKISFTAIGYDDISPIDDLIDARNGAQLRCLFVQFSGITAVTTAPLFSRVFKNIQNTAGHKSENSTSLVAQGASPDFSGAQASVLPITGDLTLFGWDEKPLRLFPTLPSRFEAFVIRKSLARIALMRQQVGETAADWELRINLEAQAAPAGSWATSFWAQLDAAVAAETPDGVKGGPGRGQ